MSIYYRPIVQIDPARPETAETIAGGWCWFDRVEAMERGRPARLLALSDVPRDVLVAITAPRAPLVGLNLTAPKIMGILNVTPDSFSDGGRFNTAQAAVERAHEMALQGADILDVGGESTRPGASFVSAEEECRRTAPVIESIRKQSAIPISIDTRKSAVARAAIRAGADLINDVSALGFDPEMAPLIAKEYRPVCLMHAQGNPETMQDDPTYRHALLDVYDALAARVDAAVAAGIPRAHIVVDPGIGFGKTQDHNLELLRGISLFHTLGCPILLGASRKRFIGNIGQVKSAEDRAVGSVAVALGAIAQGVQIVRVHDIKETKQAIRLKFAVMGEK